MTLEVLFVGIGSIAKRHIRNLREVCCQKGIAITIDALRRKQSNSDDLQELGIREVITELSFINKEYDIVFITNPTELHLDTIEELRHFGKHFFVEKPIASVRQIDRLNNLSVNEKSIYYVACPLRYNAVIQYIKNNVDINDIMYVRSISSSYLPNWRPGIDYRTTYSAHKELGGGVSIDLIHEWDYLTFLFGKPNKVLYLNGKKSSLEIDSDDCAEYIAEYSNKFVSLHLDYFGRKTIREIMLFTKNDTIVGDLLNNRITFLSNGEIINFNEERDDFQKRELFYFLDIIEGKVVNNSSISHAFDTLKLTQGLL